MIFDSREAADKYEEWMNSSLILFFQNVGEFIQSGIMYDGVVTPDKVKYERMRNAAESALAILDRLNGEVDAAFRKDNRDLACDINRAMGDLEDILIRLEALE